MWIWERAERVIRRDTTPGELTVNVRAIQCSGPRIDNQFLPFFLPQGFWIPEGNATLLVAVVFTQHQVSLQFRELVPGGFLVGQMDRPLDFLDLRILQCYGLARVIRILIVISEDLKSGSLPLDPSAGVFELAHWKGRPSLNDSVALVVTLDWQTSDGFRSEIELGGTVANPGDTNGRMNRELVGHNGLLGRIYWEEFIGRCQNFNRRRTTIIQKKFMIIRYLDEATSGLATDPMSGEKGASSRASVNSA
jgi:hypothetical protein